MCPTTKHVAPRWSTSFSAVCSGPRSPISSRITASASQPGIAALAWTSATSARSSIASDSAGLGRSGPPSATSTSAGVVPRLGPSREPQCTTTRAPAAAASTAAASDRCGASLMPSNAPAQATIGRPPDGGSGATARAASRSARAIPASSLGVSPLIRIAIRKAPAWTGLTSPRSSAAVASRASSKVSARLPRGPVPTALMTARKPP